MPIQTLFESVACGRCGGSGHYSYCTMHGSTCFKCRGAGRVLTKRGFAAQRYLDDLRKIRLDAVQVGDRVVADSFFKVARSTVVAVAVKPCNVTCNGVLVREFDAEVRCRFDDGEFFTLSGPPESTMRRVLSKDAAAALRAQALAYQDTLTKSGQPRKGVAA